jgi:hypothetical protein
MEKPILFSTQMIQAILESKKTQTRRIIKPQPSKRLCAGFVIAGGNKNDIGKVMFSDSLPVVGKDGAEYIKAPFKPKEILWVRETWFKNEECLLYKASKYEKTKAYHGRNGWVQIKWRPSIFMPREAARIFLRVTNVRAERLQEISAHECVLEGIDTGDILLNTPKDGNFAEYAKEQFKRLWDSINAKRGYCWDTNPWVWVIEFERVNNI